MGATGYVGMQLVPRLLELGHDVRVAVRDPTKARAAPWIDRVELRQADLADSGSLAGLADGVEAAYYLVHAMADTTEFEEKDRQFAAAFVQHVRVPHTIYLGGLQPDGEAHAHLRSRAEVGRILATQPTTEFRAGPVIGSGSASFEMVRYLTERLPVMAAPKWISHHVRPIAARDVVAYLVAALAAGPSGVVDIGGKPETFADMMRIYAKARGLRRFIVPVPVLAPRLAARWVGFVTPISNRLAVPIIEGILEDLVGDTRRAQALFPDVHCMDYPDAVARALQEDRAHLDEGLAGESMDWENMRIERRVMEARARPEEVYEAVLAMRRLPWPWVWRFRGGLDKLVGGAGLQPRPERLAAGFAFSYWKVRTLDAPRRIELEPNLKLPGNGWVRFDILEISGGTRLVQTAFFEPRGAWGHAYWWMLMPLHRLIFSRLVRNLAADAEALPHPTIS